MNRETRAAETVFIIPHTEAETSGPLFSFHFSFYETAKRVVDFTVSLLVVSLLLSWLLPILAIIIRLDSKGSAFFVQTRIGYLGMPFRCYKLRTMLQNSESDCLQAQHNDARITAVGRLLRSTNLDELPQFMNVLLGDMSLVGPRPFMLKDDEEFSSVVANYYLRYYAKSGITGIAQMKGCRGKTETDLDIIHRYQWDAFYIRNAGMFLDMKIMWVTVQQTLSAIAGAGRSKAKQLRRTLDGEMMVLQVNEAA